MTDVALAPSLDGITDFTDPTPPKRFRIGEDVFEVVPGLPALSFMEFAELAGQKIDEPGEARSAFQRMFRLVLQEDSAERFLTRLEDRHQPITIQQVQQVIPFVLEQLGLRPTEPPDSSSNGSGDPAPGPNSTASAPPPESTSVVYPFPPSSTTSTGS